MPKGVYVRVPVPITERIWRYVVKGPGCWHWTGTGVGPSGRGTIRECGVDGKLVLATHVMFEIAHGRRPTDSVLHTCDNPSCVNPDHLFEGTQADNLDDMVRKGRSGNRKLTSEQVRAIRARYAAGETVYSISKNAPVSYNPVRSIVHRLTYKYVT